MHTASLAVLLALGLLSLDVPLLASDLLRERADALTVRLGMVAVLFGGGLESQRLLNKALQGAAVS